MDLEAVEGLLRAAVLAAGAGLLEQLLETVGVGRRGASVRCSCGARMDARKPCARVNSRGLKATALLTLLGPVRFARSMFHCARCGKTRYPGDEELDVAGTTRSPGVRRLAARFGAKETFKEVAEDLYQAAGIRLSPKDAERIAETVGA